MVAKLPGETVARRGNYWRIGHSLLQNDQHWHEHIEQIEAALAQPKARGLKRARHSLTWPVGEATAGFEPAIGVLQTPALPLGYVAAT